MKALLNPLFRRGVILTAFVVAKGVAGLIQALTFQTTEAWGTAILSVLVYAVIARFAYTRQIISVWAMVIIMLYESFGQIASALQKFGVQPLISVITLILSTYFIIGALGLYLNRRSRG